MDSGTADLPAPAPLRIDVVYALADQQVVVTLAMPGTATVQDAVEQSGLMRRFPEITLRPLTCAIFSRIIDLSTQLQDGDRVEILRLLLIDPKESRRQAAARNRNRR